MNQNPESYLLLTVPEATVSQVFDGQRMELGRGELAIECVSLPIPPEIGYQTANPFEQSPNDPAPTHDLWLVLRVGDNFERTLEPGNAIEARSPPGGDGGPTYIFRETAVPGAELILYLEPPRSQTQLEDMGTLEALFKQYGVLPSGSGLDGVEAPVVGRGSISFSDADEKGAPPTYESSYGAGSSGAGPSGGAAAAGVGAAGATAGAAAGAGAYHDEKESPVVHGGAANDLRGKLVLMDQDSGAVIGELDNNAKIEEDVANEAPTAPVMVDFGPIVANTREVKVTRIPPDELDDWILRSANWASRGILGASGAATAAMNRGAERYRQKTIPRPQPVRIPHAATSGLKMAHGASTKGATVTGKTVQTINGTIERLVSKKQTGGTTYAAPQPKRSTFGKLKDAAVPAAASAAAWAKDKYNASGQGQAGTAAGAGAHQQPGYQAGSGVTPAYPQGGAPGGAAPPLPARTPEKGGLHAAGAGHGGHGAGYGGNGYDGAAGHGAAPGHGAGGYGDQQHYGAGQGYGQTPGYGSHAGGYGDHKENLNLAGGYGGAGGHSGFASGYGGHSDEKGGAPPLSPGAHSPGGSGAVTPSGKRKRRPLLNRTLLAADVVLSSLEAAASDLVTSGTHAASTVVGHKYGTDAGAAVAYTGASMRNAVLVYVDVRGVARRGILKSTAKGWVKSRLRSGEDVRLEPMQQGQTAPQYTGHKDEVVVGVPQAKR